MERLLCVSLCLLTFTGKTLCDDVDIVKKITCNEDEDVILPCSFKVYQKDQPFDWKKGDMDVFFLTNGKPSWSSQPDQFKGRVSYFPDQLLSGNASISIKQAKASDSGTYICNLINSRESYKIELTVGSVAKPSFTIVSESDGWALLRCNVIGAFPEPSVVWYNSAGINVNNKEPQVIENNGLYDVILDTRVTKTDHYTCVATQPEINHQLNLTTYIHIGGSVAKPSFTIVSESDGWALLRCNVIGADPEPSVVWYNSAGKKVSDKEPQVIKNNGRYDVILDTRVTKTDHYTCVATQEELNHQLNLTTYIQIGGEKTSDETDEKTNGYVNVPIIAVGAVGGVAVVLAVIVIVLCSKICCGKKDQR